MTKKSSCFWNCLGDADFPSVENCVSVVLRECETLQFNSNGHGLIHIQALFVRREGSSRSGDSKCAGLSIGVFEIQG